MTVGLTRESWGEVQLVWATPSPAHVDDPLLDAAERERCAGYRWVADRARHATGRVTAKREAARLLGVAPQRVSVRPDTGPTAGRPRLRVDGQPVGIELSIAHAGEVVLLALTEGICGVDVEQTGALQELVGSDLIFSGAERAELGALPKDERLVRATSWWTAKEALLKATGRGLHEDPAAVEVLTPVVRLGTVRLRWWELAAPTGYQASLATSAP